MDGLEGNIPEKVCMERNFRYLRFFCVTTPLPSRGGVRGGVCNLLYPQDICRVF